MITEFKGINKIMKTKENGTWGLVHDNQNQWHQTKKNRTQKCDHDDQNPWN